MTLAILFAFASAACLGAGVVTAQFGLRSVEPLSGAAISVPAFTLLFLLLSPLLLAGEPVVWRGVPIFAAIGLVFPALLTLLTFASNRALGPVVTSTLGNLAPLFAVALAVLVLHEPLRALQFAGLVIAVAGAVIITVTRPRDFGELADLGAAAAARRRGAARRHAAGRQARARGLAEPALGLPDRLRHVVAGRADRSARPQGQFCRRRRHGPGRLWFAVTGILQRPERADAVCRRAPRADYAGRAAGGGLSAGHRAAERDHAPSGADHARGSSPEPR